MLMLYFILALAITLLIAALLHWVLVNYLKKYDENVNQKMNYWRVQYRVCEEKKIYRLKRRELRKLKNPIYITAFFSG